MNEQVVGKALWAASGCGWVMIVNGEKVVLVAGAREEDERVSHHLILIALLL